MNASTTQYYQKQTESSHTKPVALINATQLWLLAGTDSRGQPEVIYQRKRRRPVAVAARLPDGSTPSIPLPKGKSWAPMCVSVGIQARVTGRSACSFVTAVVFSSIISALPQRATCATVVRTNRSVRSIHLEICQIIN